MDPGNSRNLSGSNGRDAHGLDVDQTAIIFVIGIAQSRTIVLNCFRRARSESYETSDGEPDSTSQGATGLPVLFFDNSLRIVTGSTAASDEQWAEGFNQLLAPQCLASASPAL